MKMAEAKQKLMDIAKGRYHSMEYTIDDHGGGNVSQKCKVYIPNYGFFEATRWEDAIAALESAIKGRPRISEELPISQPEQNHES